MVSTNGNGASPRPAEVFQDQEDEFDFGKLLRALQRRRRLAITVMAASLISGAAYTFWQRTFHPIFQGSFKLLVSDPINPEDGSRGEDSGEIASVALRGGGTTNTGTLIEVLTSPLLLEPLERKLNLGLGSLEGRISVAPSGGARKEVSGGVLTVKLLWPDPVEGKQILDTLSQEYLSYSLRQRQEKLTQGLEFLDQQAPELQQRVNTLQNALARFRQENGFVAPEEQAGAILGQRQDLVTQLKTLQLDQAKLEGRATAVRRGQLETKLDAIALGPSSAPGFPGAPGMAPAPETSAPRFPEATTPRATTPLEDLFAVETALTEAEANYTEASPQVQELRAKRDQLRPLLQRRQLGEIQADLAQNLIQQQEIRRQLEQLFRGFSATPQQIKQYDALQQQLEVARENLSSYIKARESFRLQVAQRTKPWRILAHPRFVGTPVAPSVPRNLLMSALLGALGGAGLALLRDRMDHVFHSPGELMEGLSVPLLGVVPHLPGREGVTISQSLASLEGGERFAIRESLRNLFANFRLLRADKPVRLVAVTSSTQGEGKSTTTALFAQTLSQMGQKVLLVDADMRRPRLHRYLGADNDQGLSSLLTDSDLKVNALVLHLQEGLDLLTAGPVPPDPTQLLSSERCGLLVEQIRQLQGYDLVIFDTPPALLLSDPVLLAEHLDGLIFLVGLSRVNRDLPAQALQRVGDTGVDVLGVLANQPVLRGAGGRGYGYGYGYGYGKRYGYGYGYGEKKGYGAYADAAQRQPKGVGQAAEVVEIVAPDTNGSRRPASARTSSSRWSKPLWAGARKVMAWLDQRE